MEKEDPIEKFERKQAEKQSNGGLKALMIAMIVIALGLAAALYYAVLRLLNVAILRECMQFVKKKR